MHPIKATCTSVREDSYLYFPPLLLIIVVTGILVAEGALTLLEDDVGLNGGVYTAALLGQGLIDRLEKAGLKFETKVIEAGAQ